MRSTSLVESQPVRKPQAEANSSVGATVSGADVCSGLTTDDWFLVNNLHLDVLSAVCAVLNSHPDDPALALTQIVGSQIPFLCFTTHTDRNLALVRIAGDSVSVRNDLLQYSSSRSNSTTLVNHTLITEAVVVLMAKHHCAGSFFVRSFDRLSMQARDTFFASRAEALKTFEAGNHLPRPDIFSPICIDVVIDLLKQSAT